MAKFVLGLLKFGTVGVVATMSAFVMTGLVVGILLVLDLATAPRR